MASVPNYYLSQEEYLALERKAEFKSEYMDGVVYAFAECNPQHNLIAANLIATLGTQLKGRPGKVYSSNLRVRVPKSKCFFYPDVSVVSHDYEVADDEQDVLLNPTLIVEVSSKSTAAFDRGKNEGITMRVFDGSKSASADFEQWKVNHPAGFVINVSGNQLMLHLASCGHFKFRETDDIKFAPKRTSFDREELDNWARREISKRYLICSNCKP